MTPRPLAEELEKYRPMLTAHALRKTRSREAAEDAVQTALMKALTGPPPDSRRNPGSYLMTILNNVIFDRNRYVKRRVVETPLHVELPSGADEMDFADPAKNPEELLCAQSLSPRFEEFIAGLTPSQKQAVRLVLQDQNLKDAAASIGVNEAAIKLALHRVRVRAKKNPRTCTPNALLTIDYA